MNLTSEEIEFLKKMEYNNSHVVQPDKSIAKLLEIINKLRFPTNLCIVDGLSAPCLNQADDGHFYCKEHRKIQYDPT